MKWLPDMPLPALRPMLRQWRSRCPHRVLWSLLCGLTLMLSGCVESDLGVRFSSPNRGEIVQQIQWSERLQSASGETLPQWVKQVEQQVANVGGAVQKDASQALTITIPFTSSAELEQKFNQFLNGVFNQEQLSSRPNLPLIASQLKVSHSNFLLVERDRLRYDIDLRSLGIASTNGNLLVSPASLIRLQFYLETPWGARNIVRSDTLRPRSLQGGKKLIWNLIPGEQNTLETVFWLPNPLGIGTVVILGFVLLGLILKYPQSAGSRQEATVSVPKSSMSRL